MKFLLPVTQIGIRTIRMLKHDRWNYDRHWPLCWLLTMPEDVAPT